MNGINYKYFNKRRSENKLEQYSLNLKTMQNLTEVITTANKITLDIGLYPE